MNRDTLRTPYVSAHRATLTGWRRVWVSSPDGTALLSVESSATDSIDGLILCDYSTSLSSLDEREHNYTRRSISFSDFTYHDSFTPLVCDCYLYTCDFTERGEGSIIRSYLDAVCQGYLREFGELGLSRFISSTYNFALPITEDRDSPLYPRAITLTSVERSLLDFHFPYNE